MTLEHYPWEINPYYEEDLRARANPLADVHDDAEHEAETFASAKEPCYRKDCSAHRGLGLNHCKEHFLELHRLARAQEWPWKIKPEAYGPERTANSVEEVFLWDKGGYENYKRGGQHPKQLCAKKDCETLRTYGLYHCEPCAKQLVRWVDAKDGDPITICEEAPGESEFNVYPTIAQEEPDLQHENTKPQKAFDKTHHQEEPQPMTIDPNGPAFDGVRHQARALLRQMKKLDDALAQVDSVYVHEGYEVPDMCWAEYYDPQRGIQLWVGDHCITVEDNTP